MRSTTNGITALVAGIVLLTAGCALEEGDICEDYCSKAGECAMYNYQMFSEKECKLQCDINVQRHDSVSCEEESRDYLSCLIDLSCNNWGSQGSHCSTEVDRLNSCIDRNS